MKKSILMPLAVLVLSVIIAVGSSSFLGPCVHEDGSFGTCHWAGQAMIGVGCLLSVQSIILLISKDKNVRQGVFLAMIPTAVLGFMIPGSIISLCRMATMRCRSIMQPSMRILCVLVLLCAVAGFFSERRNAKG